MILAAESNSEKESATESSLRVFEKLRFNLSRLIGVGGYQALLNRTLVLAGREITWLQIIKTAENGMLQGFAEAAAQQPSESASEGCETLLAHFLALHISFIGEYMTFNQIRDIWKNDSLMPAKITTEEITR